MRHQTALDHEQRLETAVHYILEHLDEPMDIRDLADRVCLSRFHFHRVFQSLLGETVGELVRRLRLERAAHRLRATAVPITELAFDAGYATHEAFIRAFRAAFGCTPSTIRRRLEYNGRLPARNGIHFGAEPQIRFITFEGVIEMKVEIRDCASRKAICMSHSGPYFMIGSTFSKLGAWIGRHRVPMEQGIALYYDDPNNTPPDELRSDAGAIVPADFQTNDPTVHMVNVPGGTYAVGLHCGPYEGLPNAWNDIVGKWLPTSGRTLDSRPSFELYLNDCTKVAPEELRTELYIPLAPE